jgi:flagellar protein FlaG
MQVAITGNSQAFTPTLMPAFQRVSSGSSQQDRVRTAEQRLAAIKKFTSMLPGTRGNGEPHDLEAVADDLERISSTMNKKLRFSVDHESHEIFIKVIDPETDKVVKVLPPEELRRLHHKIKEAIGVIFNELI